MRLNLKSLAKFPVVIYGRTNVLQLKIHPGASVEDPDVPWLVEFPTMMVD